jgi:hypothetical protein
MTSIPHRTLAAIALSLLAAAPLSAQSARAERVGLPRSRADALLAAGLWPQAEEAYYAQSRVRPRDPIPRAALGRYLAMRGAVLPGPVLIEDALQFGLDSSLAVSLLRPWRAVLGWRKGTTLEGDSVMVVRTPRDTTSLFRMPFTWGSSHGGRRLPGRRPGDTVWVDVAMRAIGIDSVFARTPRVGVETLEALLPALDVATGRLTLHADARSASKAQGERYRVLRDAREIRVLMTSGRTLPLSAALRELAPSWWQLDLPHGVLVVR